MGWPWRVWLAFEERPGITASRYLSDHGYRTLARSCQARDGRLDAVQIDRWIELLVEHAHAWGDA